MSDQESTRDLMSVDSFSQLPFIRPSSSNPSNSSAASIRLFGFEFPPDSPSEKQGGPVSTETAGTTVSAADAAGIETGRKFECHYCCRNFPTSQALGGHQNAHKRERQQAKRAHLQSAMAAAHHHHHHRSIIPESHVYGILNYHRLGSSPNGRLGLEPPTVPPPHYPSWNGGAGGGDRFYSGLGSVSQPINGNPLPPGLWSRVPNATMGMMAPHRDSRSVLVPVFGSTVDFAGGGGGGRLSSSSSSSSSLSHGQGHRGNESCAKDHSVSLDLHL